MTSALYAGATPAEFGGLLHAYVDSAPGSVIRAIGARGELVGPEGGLQPLGVVDSLISAMLTWAWYSVRLTWFQSLGWVRVSRMLRGLCPTPPEGKSAGEAAPGFEVPARPGAFDLHYGS